MTTKTKIKKSEITSGQAKSYSFGDSKIVVCNVNNEYFAIEDVCSHDEGELVSGQGLLVENCQLECPRHGARFNVKTGEATRMPAVAPIKTYKVKILSDELEIEIME
ncbi:MAG: non-heme iron oxygenase ferredoxin subunit [Candidatus Melainabacteria bacterium]|nr:non-heme iron oxygenase ferredoxin subunit [Candidatus Melainabacteria bacterium]